MGGSASLTYHERLGGGNSGEVYRVTWRSKDHGTIEAAAKKIRYEGEVIESAREEVEFLKKLNHRNIIKYYDTMMEKEHVVIITEYAAKGSLYHYLKDKNKLPDNLRNKWIFQLACGIHHLKENNLTHRDLKSLNCVITEDDVLKICDFGLARYLNKTTTTNLKGTIKWLAPEAIRDLQLSPQADIFAFGIITWEIVSCDEPYKGMRVEAIMYQVCESGLRPTIPANCPIFLKELMEKCWHGDRNKRPSSLEIVQSLGRHFQADLELEQCTESDGAEWKMKHEISQSGVPYFVSGQLVGDHLAICTDRSILVHQVTRDGTRLLYTLKSHEWEGGMKYPCGLAMSDSMPNSILVIRRRPWGQGKSYVYQFPCHEASHYEKKYQIHDGHVYPWCIAANSNTAVIGIYHTCEVIVCSLPDFTNQRMVKLDITPLDLCITASNLLLMGLNEIVVKPLGCMDQDLCRVKPPRQGFVFRAVSFRNDEAQLYAACFHGAGRAKGGIYKYIREGHDRLGYSNTGCVIDNLLMIWTGGLHVTSDGSVLAVSQKTKAVKIFSLEY